MDLEARISLFDLSAALYLSDDSPEIGEAVATSSRYRRPIRMANTSQMTTRITFASANPGPSASQVVSDEDQHGRKHIAEPDKEGVDHLFRAVLLLARQGRNSMFLTVLLRE